MSSPARSSASAATTALMGGTSSNALNIGEENNSPFHFPTDLISVQDRKEEAMLVLKSDVMASLQKEVKSLDEDCWKFAQPRSKIHLISKPGIGFVQIRMSTRTSLNHFPYSLAKENTTNSASMVE